MNPSLEGPARPPRKKRSGGVVVPNQPRWFQRVAAWLVFAFIRGVSATLRYRWENRSGFAEGPPIEPTIFCVWHNRLALCLPLYFGYARQRGFTPRMAAMVSASKDGAFLAAVLDCFKVQPVRGSTSRRGPQALLELTTWAERGYDLAITPDGPRGPRYVIQPGIMSLAQLTGRPIQPASYHLSWKYKVKSWDGFQIPLPFSRCHVIYTRPLRVPRDATDAQRENIRQELERSLREISID